MPTYTLSYLQRQVYDRLDNNTQFFPTAQVTLAINQGMKRLNLLVGVSQATVPVPGWSQSNQYLYQVPAGIVVPLRVYFEGRQLETLSLASLARRYRNWIFATTANQGTAVLRAAFMGLTQFVLNPADARGGSMIEVVGIAPIAPLVNSGDQVYLDDEFADIVISYSVMRVLAKEGGQLFRDASGIYKEAMSNIKAMILWEGSNFPDYELLRQVQ